MEDILPEFLSMGVSFERFMDSCPKELEPFESAYKKTIEMQNSLMYTQGLYFRDALLSSLGNSQWFKAKGQPNYEYPDKPYTIFDKENSSTEEDQIKDPELRKFIAQEKIRRANWRVKHKKNNEEQ